MVTVSQLPPAGNYSFHLLRCNLDSLMPSRESRERSSKIYVFYYDDILASPADELKET